MRRECCYFFYPTPRRQNTQKRNQHCFKSKSCLVQRKTNRTNNKIYNCKHLFYFQREPTCGSSGRDLHVHGYLVLSHSTQVPGGVAELQLLQGHGESPDSVIADCQWRVFKAPLSVRQPTGAPVSVPAPLLHVLSVDGKSQGESVGDDCPSRRRLKLPGTKQPRVSGCMHRACLTNEDSATFEDK